MRYSEKGSTVILDTTNIIQNELIVKTIDFGTGISEEYLPHIFEPYYQSSEQQTRQHKGAGLGLAICQRLLSLQDIDLKVESKLGEGTVFSFNLQIVD